MTFETNFISLLELTAWVWWCWCQCWWSRRSFSGKFGRSLPLSSGKSAIMTCSDIKVVIYQF